uniref:Bromodomain adjacent to zinc finger domain protein 1A n=1 Tax=Laticauda laticaudata TaxID=8630 RepID=A0A8C5T0D9_LATLA
MPLLHRKPFVREKPPADLRPDEHVFHSRVTNEIFRDYDEFFERTILCNSLVWSCAITGKSGLTYQEALESERKARQNIQNFPEPLIVPVLYLVTLTQRSRLHEVCDDIFAYIKNRYFVGELVEVLRNNGERLYCKILEIKAPVHQNGIANGHAKGVDGVTIIISDSDDSDLDTSSAQNGNEKAITDPFLYKYKVKPLKKQLYESVTVKASQICSNSNSPVYIFEIEKLKREKENAMKFKRKEKQDKEKRKEELKKLVEEERLKKKEEKERLKIEKEKEREKLREEKKKYLEHLKQWSKRREDMECDDLKELPVPTPVKTRLPPEIFGDAVMVLEFLHAFGELFDLQDEFPDGVTLEVLEEALVGNDSEGPLCELLFFFLTAIFQAMAEEEEEVAKDQIADAETKDLTEALDEDADPTKSALSAVATLAAAWPQLHQGCNLKNLDLDSCTLSEILRLHILASGADVTSANAKYRYQKRGGFDTTDDACMELRLSNPGLLKKLSCTSVYDLSSAEKMRILHALCGKLLTLVSTRDFIEDSVDVLRQTKQEFRELKAEQHRREREAAAAKIRRKKEERLKGQEQKMKEKHEKLKEMEKTPAVELCLSCGLICNFSCQLLPGQGGQNGFKDFTRPVGATDDKCELLTAEEEAALKQEQQNKEKELIEKIQKATVCTNISSLGRDRLYRRYWLFSSVPGLFVEEDYSGLTEDMLLPRPSSFHNVQAHISEKSQIVIKTGESLTAESTSKTCQDLETSTIVNVSQPIQKPNKWCFYSSQEQFDQLLEALNSRGYRESALKDVLLQEKSRICEQFSSFPVEKFYISEKTQNEAKPQFGRGKMQNGCDMVQKSAEKQLELRLRDFLLDIEDRIFQGTLGSIKVMDRYSWRAALENGQYEFLNEENKENGVIKPVNENVEEMEIDNQVRILAKDRLIGLKPESRSTTSTNTSTPQPMNNTVHYLALALLQIQQGIERKFLKAPLGDAEENKRDPKGDKRRKREDDQSKYDGNDAGRSHKTVLDRWKESLLSSASLSQIFLHLSTLERSVIWSKSILNTRCKMCRKKGDAESMVLCDGCDRGYHIYCIRPKLKAVPDGDWFCPECRPKQRSRRLSSRQRPSVESDEETIEEIKEEDETSCEEIGQSEYDYEEEEEDENIDNSDSQEDEKSLSKLGNSQVKLTLRTRAPKLASNQLSTGRYNSRSQQNTPKQIGSSYKGLGKNIRKTKSAPPSVTKTLRLSSRITRHKQEMLKADAFVELTSHRRQRRGMKTTDTVEDSNFVFKHFVLRYISLPHNLKTDLCQIYLYGFHSSYQTSRTSCLEAKDLLGMKLFCMKLSLNFFDLLYNIQVPDYYDIIKKPVALNIIREKVNKCEYKVASEFIEDVELMFSNCFEYNARNTSEAKAGTRLQAFFHVQAQKLGLPVASGYMNHVAPAAKKSRI